MNPTEQEVKQPVIEAELEGDIADSVLSALDKETPPAKPAPAAPKTDLEPGDLAAPAPEPAKPPVKPAEPVDPLSPDFLAAAAPKKDESGMPADLLKDEDIERLPEKKQREAFAKERAAHKEARQRLQELNTKVNELSSKAQDAEQAAALKQQLEAKEEELAKLNAEIAKIDLTRSPEFKKRYDDRMNQLGQRMVQTLVTEGVDQAEAAKLIQALVAETKPSAREYAIDEAAPSLKGTLLAYLNQFDEVAQERAVALDKAKETAAAIDEAESRARIAAMAGRVDSVTEKAIADAAALGSPYYREVKDNEDWNAAVAERKQTLKGLLLTMDPEKLAPYVAEGLTTPDLRRRYVEQYNRLKAVEAEFEQVIGQRPRLGQLNPSEAPPAPHQVKLPDNGLDIVDVVEDFLK